MMICTEVDVEVDEEEVVSACSDEMLVHELQSRGFICSKGVAPSSELLDRLHMALKFNDEICTRRAASDLLWEVKGVIA